MFLSLCLACKEDTLVTVSQNIAIRSNLTDCWICYQIPWSIQDQYEPVIILFTDFRYSYNLQNDFPSEYTSMFVYYIQLVYSILKFLWWNMMFQNQTILDF